ncbi:MAG: ATP phosphoribosyltransferase regulatory subunit, partial [Singulisphaera sp.]|nr:ATP phosphoribosyltransferase regulatory subunit [Singulisphaera sp.]
GESSGRSALLSEDQARQVLDFVEQGRGGPEVLDWVEQRLGAHPRAAEGIANLRTILALLDAAGVRRHRLAIDLGLARGLDYYTGVVFETTVPGWERFGSIASGGRYDNLASLFTERRLPGVGASIGLDRLLALMEEAGWLEGTSTTVPILVANFPGVDPAIPIRLAGRLRASGIDAEVFPEPLQIGKQMGYGSSRGHKLAVIVGPDERARQVFNLRDLATREERRGIAWDDLESAVKNALDQIEGS